jgi:hypothetical protein
MTDWIDSGEKMKRLRQNELDRLSWREDVGAISWMILIGMIGLFVSLVRIKSCEPVPAAASRSVWQKPCHDCHNYKSQLTSYFKKKGSKTPEELANAVIRTRNTRLLSAVAIVESNGNKDAVNIKHGRKNKSVGAYQVRPRHWKTVPPDAYGQSLQTESILESLVEEQNGDIRKALSAYGGSTTDKYANKVLAELREVP